MFKKIRSTFIVINVSMLSAFLTTIFLARKLSIADFGGYSLIKQIITIGTSIATLGLGHSFTRNFANKKGCLLEVHGVTGLILFVMSFFLGMVIQKVYNYSITQTFWMFLAIFCGAVSIYTAANYRINNRYFIGQITESSWKIILFLTVIFIYILKISVTLNIMYLLIFLSFLLPSLTYFTLFCWNQSDKKEEINYREYFLYGLTFWTINSAGLLSGAIDKFIIPIIFSKEILGIFTSLSFIYITFFNMLGSAIGYVLFPTLSKGERINWKKMLVLVGSILAFSVILFAVLGKYLVSIAYGGKYDEYNSWFFINSFIFLGIIQMINTIAHFIMLAFGKRRDLILYFGTIIGSTGLFIAMIWISRTFFRLSLQTLTLNIIGMWIIKIIGISLIFLAIYRRNKTNDNKNETSFSELNFI